MVRFHLDQLPMSLKNYLQLGLIEEDQFLTKSDQSIVQAFFSVTFEKVTFSVSQEFMRQVCKTRCCPMHAIVVTLRMPLLLH